jgi:WD40 repeat protein
MTTPPVPPDRTEHDRDGLAPPDPADRHITSTPELADTEHPWLGLESFSEATRPYFFGREAEIGELQLRLRSHPLLVLYGRSGLGKTSILTAGLLPRLRDEAHRPLLLRLRFDDADRTPEDQLTSAVFGWDGRRTDRAQMVRQPTKPLHWIHGLEQSLGLELPGDALSRLWLRLHHRHDGPDITHLIVDQFEEVFSLGSRSGRENDVRDVLTILLQGVVPRPIVRLIAQHDSLLDIFDPDSVPVRVVLSMRDDYVYALNRWRRHLPALGQNNFELRALRGSAAFDAVFEPGQLRCHYRGPIAEENRVDTGLPPIIDRETAARIVQFVAGDGSAEEVEAVPPILSLLCRELNERRIAAAQGSADPRLTQVTFREADAHIGTIVAAFYERCLVGRPDAVRLFVEEQLVSLAGGRVIQDERSILSAFERGYESSSAAGVRSVSGFGDQEKARACLAELVNLRLLTSVSGQGFELIHDLIAQVADRSRAARRTEGERRTAEQLALERRQAELERERAARTRADEERALADERSRLADHQQRLARQGLKAAERHRRVIAALLVIASLIAAMAVHQWWRARSLTRQAERQLSAASFREATVRAADGRSAEALAFAARALRLHDSASNRTLTRDLLVTTPRSILELRHPSSVTTVAWHPAGTRLATADRQGTAHIWDTRTGFAVGAMMRHYGVVSSVGWSSDGTRLATASDDRTARVWDASTGAAVTAPLRHDAAVTVVRWSGEGTRVATASDDHSARIWNARTGEPVTAPLRHDGIVYSVGWSADSARVATASLDGTARIWDARRGHAVGGPLRHRAAVMAVEWSADGNHVATASRDGTAQIWDARTGRPVGASLRHEDPVTAVAWSADSTRVATASADNAIRIWDVVTGDRVAALLRHDAALLDFAWSADGTRIATAAEDSTARIWDARTGRPIGAAFRHQNAVNAVAWSPDGTGLATASLEGTARLWHTHATQALGLPLRHDGPVSAVAWNVIGDRLATVSTTGEARIWDARTGRATSSPLRHQAAVSAIAWSPDGGRIATASDDKTGRIWDARTAQPLGASLHHNAAVSTIAWNPDGNRVATASRDGTARIWDVQTGAEIRSSLRHASAVTTVAWSADGTRVATASEDNTARIWDAETGGPGAGSPLRHDSIVTAVAWNAAGTRVATASWDRTARIWDAGTSQPVGAPMRHEGTVLAVVWSPDGSSVATASSDGTAQIWNARSAERVGAPLRHDAAVIAVTWSADGTRVATASDDHTARIWDARSGQALADPFEHGGGVTGVAWSTDGTRLATASSDWTARVWDASPFDGRVAPQLAELAEIVSGFRVNEAEAIEPDDDFHVRLARLNALIDRMNQTDREGSPFRRFVNWLVADPWQRPISPISTMTSAEYERIMLELASLRRADGSDPRQLPLK